MIYVTDCPCLTIDGLSHLFANDFLGLVEHPAFSHMHVPAHMLEWAPERVRAYVQAHPGEYVRVHAPGCRRSRSRLR